MEQFSSKLLENAVAEFAQLPGIGKKTALRLVLHLLKQEKDNVNRFGNALISLRRDIKHCITCQNVSDTEECSICSDKSRDRSTICVVENIRDVMSIENTHQYRGLYHVLGGIISPMDGIGPSDLEVESLLHRIETDEVDEVILALSTTMEGDTTNFYLYKKLKPFDIEVSTLARGVSIGDEIEYTDELTLGRSIINRMSFVNSIGQ